MTNWFKSHTKGILLYLIIILVGAFLIQSHYTSKYLFKMIWLNWICLLVLMIILRIIQTKVRGYFWRDKFENELSFKEFLGSWKRGIDGITPFQQTKMNLWGTWLVILGLALGVFVTILLVFFSKYQPNGAISFIVSKPIWALMALVGGLFLTLISLIGLVQRYHAQKRIEIAKKQLEEESNIEFNYEGECGHRFNDFLDGDKCPVCKMEMRA